MAFYPTWQADPSQGWQNQFIQQIPQNTPAITSLNSIDFQPQSYAYQPNGYVQTGIGFDPNYGRTYAAPVQRYEFQTQQIAPINQVSLQSVSFAPTVTYAGQVSTAPAPPVILPNAQQQPVQGASDLNKNVSGNDMPGYPRVNSVPPRSLNCNGYSGDFVGGSQTQTSQQQQPQHQQSNSGSNNSSAQQSQQQQQQPPSMHPPPQQNPPSQQTQSQQIPQSPNRNLMNQQQQRHVSQSPNQISQSPNNHMQQYPVQQSPNHNQQQMIHNPHQGMHTPNPQQQQQQTHPTSPTHTQINQDWNWNNQPQSGPSDIFNQGDRVNLNTRLKTMILRKNDPKDLANPEQMQPPTGPAPNPPTGPIGQQSQNQTGHFLSYSHHLRGDSVSANGSSVGHQPHLQQQPHQQTMSGSGTLSEPLGGGGSDQIWKPHTFKKPSGFQSASEPQQQQKISNKSKNEIEKSINDPGGGSGLATIPPHADIKTEKPSFPSISSFNPDPNNHCYPNPTGPGHFTIKQEPGLATQTKMEGYERNYQNFIQYADYCQTQVQGQPPAQDFQQTYQTPNFYSSGGTGYQQNFQNYSQNYQQQQHQQQQPQAPSSFCPLPSQPHQQNSSNHSKSSGAVARNTPSHLLSELDRKPPPDPTPIPTAMNYEKEIPAHTYPIPERFLQQMQNEKLHAAEHHSHSQLTPNIPGGGNIDVGKITGYPFLGEGGPAAIKDPVGFSCCRQGGTTVPTTEHLKDGSCIGIQTKDEILDEEDEETTSTEQNGEVKAKKAADIKKENSGETNINGDERKIKQEPVALLDTSDRLEKGNKPEVPECDCFPSDKNPPEPGSYYTHLGKF